MSDLSSNQLDGFIPPALLPRNITTIDLSNNNLNGTIPTNFSRLPLLERLSLSNNSLSGSVPSSIWQNRNLDGTRTLTLDFQNNRLSNISGSPNLPSNVTVRLQGNPICANANLVQFCGPRNETESNTFSSTNSSLFCNVNCPEYYEVSPQAQTCTCAAPLHVGYRLKSPGFFDFRPYISEFEDYLSDGLVVNLSQLNISSYEQQEGPRVRMRLRLFPPGNSTEFNESEVLRIRGMFTGWQIPDSDVFGPYELINFTLLGPYRYLIPTRRSSGVSTGALVGIVLGAIAGTVTVSAIVTIIILRHYRRKYSRVSRRRHASKISIKIDGVKDFSYDQMKDATNNFDIASQVGQGGYGKVYKGILADGSVVAIKRAQEGSLQGEKEFLTEIELLSRLHHRNLVSLVGYCDEEGEQMLVYEFMPNGTLRDHLSGNFKAPLSFAMRVKIALASAKGILYLHTEADPPIFHRDIKASNILLDSKFVAKVADFGLSRLAPVPDIEGAVPNHVSTVVKGTPGYLDPEYFLTHKLTDKSDVYSLGVVFLELLTAMHPISHGKNIVREVKIAYRSGMIFSAIDDRMGSYPSECVEKFVNLALRCCQDETDARPSMLDVVRELETIWIMLPESDTRMPESSLSGSGKGSMTPPSSSSSIVKNPYVSSDVSGSDLVSGVVPTIKPR